MTPTENQARGEVLGARSAAPTVAKLQQTVEAALRRCPNWPHPETVACVYCVQTEDARAALRDLVAQAELAVDMGEALRAAHDPERWSDFLTMQTEDLLARLDGIADKEDDNGTR